MNTVLPVVVVYAQELNPILVAKGNSQFVCIRVVLLVEFLEEVLRLERLAVVGCHHKQEARSRNSEVILYSIFVRSCDLDRLSAVDEHRFNLAHYILVKLEVFPPEQYIL